MSRLTKILLYMCFYSKRWCRKNIEILQNIVLSPFVKEGSVNWGYIFIFIVKLLVDVLTQNFNLHNIPIYYKILHITRICFPSLNRMQIKVKLFKKLTFQMWFFFYVVSTRGCRGQIENNFNTSNNQTPFQITKL